MTTLLVDIGSTTIKLCEAGTRAVRVVPRAPGISPGEQVLSLTNGADRLRVCSSANAAPRVGVLGLTRGHSAPAAAAGNVAYTHLLGERPASPLPHVDILVMAGGVDGADHTHLRTCLSRTRLADHPHDVLVWAGADDPDLVAHLPVDHRAPNVLDHRLRPSPGGLSDLIHNLHLGDLVDHKGLRPLAGATETPILPTPTILTVAAERLTRDNFLPDVTHPFLLVDIGGTTTTIHHNTHHVFTDLGVANPHRALATHTGLMDLATAIDPPQARSLYHSLSEGKIPTPQTAFLTCLYLSLWRLTHQGTLTPQNFTSLLVTGGAWQGTPTPDILRVATTACGLPHAHWNLCLDHHYEFWTHGLTAPAMDHQRDRMPSP
ncbi:glutamate mutase L [Actinokineospora auranticolor]|uniref:MutL-like protein n=1 Tax=Actinokineospora auranticolor TaxID=155976 RepID=A0A2S6H199_9PSEU|nr:glutamate mutase L [Actinokineospora auranticolor]PPK71200.1 MutL-like protein [Actinokineospora auranticolor]